MPKDRVHPQEGEYDFNLKCSSTEIIRDALLIQDYQSITFDQALAILAMIKKKKR